MKHEVEMMQNEMVVVCFFNVIPAHLTGKNMEKNEKPQLG
jgi:hypothetical protein